MQETWVQSLGRDDPLEKGKVTHSSILAWRIPWAEEPGGLQSKRSQTVRWTEATAHTCVHTHTHSNNQRTQGNPNTEQISLVCSSMKFRWNKNWKRHPGSVQFSSVSQSCPTLCDPMNRSTPGLPVHHQLPKSTQTHVHWVSDAIQPSHPLSSPSPPALNLS